jgi:hypothetical protein
MKLAAFVLAFATLCSAQDGLTVRNTAHQKWSAAEAQKIYLSACAVVQREFDRTLPLAPKVTLVLGADKNEVWFVGGESGSPNGIVTLLLREWSGWPFST